MVVIDSSVWIEWLCNSETAKALNAYWPVSDQCLVPTLVQLELAKWVRRESTEEAMDQVLAHLQTCIIIPLDTSIALLAAEFCSEYKLATADAIVYATAHLHDAELLTCDAHFKGLDGVLYIEKRK